MSGNVAGLFYYHSFFKSQNGPISRPQVVWQYSSLVQSMPLFSEAPTVHQTNHLLMDITHAYDPSVDHWIVSTSLSGNVFNGEPNEITKVILIHTQ